MRLGGFFGAERVEELEPLCRQLDTHGLSAISAPERILEMSIDECAEFGERARELGIVVGEVGMWENLMTRREDLKAERVELARETLIRADAMGCRCVVSLVGSDAASDDPLEPTRYMQSAEAISEFRDIVHTILSGLELTTTKYAIEPWHNTFLNGQKAIRAFVDLVDHPSFGVHLDQMNLVSQATYFHTTELINETFDLLSNDVASVHLKDIRIDHSHMFLKMDEVNIGDGVLDYNTYLKCLAGLDPNVPCFCEHMDTEQEYALNFARLHYLAKEAGVSFKRRRE